MFWYGDISWFCRKWGGTHDRDFKLEVCREGEKRQLWK